MSIQKCPFWRNWPNEYRSHFWRDVVPFQMSPPPRHQEGLLRREPGQFRRPLIARSSTRRCNCMSANTESPLQLVGPSEHRQFHLNEFGTAVPNWTEVKFHQVTQCPMRPPQVQAAALRNLYSVSTYYVEYLMMKDRARFLSEMIILDLFPPMPECSKFHPAVRKRTSLLSYFENLISALQSRVQKKFRNCSSDWELFLLTPEIPLVGGVGYHPSMERICVGLPSFHLMHSVLDKKFHSSSQYSHFDKPNLSNPQEYH